MMCLLSPSALTKKDPQVRQVWMASVVNMLSFLLLLASLEAEAGEVEGSLVVVEVTADSLVLLLETGGGGGGGGGGVCCFSCDEVTPGSLILCVLDLGPGPKNEIPQT